MSATLNSIRVGNLEISQSPYRTVVDDCSVSSDDGSVGFREEILPAKNATAAPKLMNATVIPKVLQQAVKPTLVDTFAHVMTFLPLEDIEIARTATPVLAAAAERVAPKPLPCDDVVFVRWEPQELHTTLPSHRAARSARGAPPVTAPAVFPWRCLNCGTVTVGPRQCGTCRASLASSACRVFIGQIRKDLSAELAAAMVRSLLPDVTILHMESHTNGTDGRGKGCAWAYVNSVEDALRVTSLHKRVFVDLDADNGEGFWFVRDPALIGHLGAMADVLASARSRPVWLPRQPLVAELPANSMLAHFVQSMNNYSG